MYNKFKFLNIVKLLDKHKYPVVLIWLLLDLKLFSSPVDSFCKVLDVLNTPDHQH